MCPDAGLLKALMYKCKMTPAVGQHCTVCNIAFYLYFVHVLLLLFPPIERDESVVFVILPTVLWKQQKEKKEIEN